MNTIEINPTVAQNQATKICQANDKFSISNNVTFSEDTTIAGNNASKDTFTSLVSGTKIMHQLLARDIQCIQNVVTTFKRTDDEVKNQIEKATISPYLSEGAS